MNTNVETETKVKKNHETREQPSKLEENHLYQWKSQLVKENEELNMLKCKPNLINLLVICMMITYTEYWIGEPDKKLLADLYVYLYLFMIVIPRFKREYIYE